MLSTGKSTKAVISCCLNGAIYDALKRSNLAQSKPRTLLVIFGIKKEFHLLNFAYVKYCRFAEYAELM